jgi:membrane protease YdiL (CAAX protease family)
LSSPDSPFPEVQPPQVELPAPPPRDPVWSGWDVVMILVVAILGILVFGGIISAGLATTHHVVQGAAAIVLGVVVQCLSYCVVVLFMRGLVVRHYHRGFAEAVHWRWPGEHRWLVFAVAGMALSLVVELVSSRLPIPRTLPIDKYFQGRGAVYALSLFGISMAPLVEELFFRGFLYPVLARRMGIPLAVPFTALAFALVHALQLGFAWAPILMLFIVGLVLTIVRVVTANVVPGFLMHVGYNFMLFAMLYIATDHFRHMERMLQQ